MNGVSMGVLALFYAALAVGTFGIAWLAQCVPVAPVPRLGRRGVERKRMLERGGLVAACEPVARFLAGVVGPVPLASLRLRQERLLQRTDYHWGMTPDELSAWSVLSAATLSAASWGLLTALDQQALWALPAFALGLLLPALQLQELVNARVKDISRRLPLAIEVAAMCMGAGLDFTGSLRLLAQPTGRSEGALEREFQAILEQLELGRTRREALENFAERVPSTAVRDFVNAVVQAEQKGNPLAKVLQVQGRMLNMRRSVAAEEAAARAGVLMIVPMVLLVACILLLLMGPFLVNGVGI